MQITATGIGSGLDIEGLVSQLIAAERQPVENRLNLRQATLQAELSAFGTLKGAVSGLQGAIADVRQLSTFQARQATSSDTDVLSVSATSSAATGNFSVGVTQLAEAHSLASVAFSSTDDVVGEGLLTFRFGTTDYDSGTDTYNSFTLNPESSTLNITVDSTNNTLAGVRDAINEADAGVSATIVNDGTGYRLLINSSSTGQVNSLEIAAVDTDGNNTDTSGLSRLAFNSSATNLEQTVAAVDAAMTINGLAVGSASNELSGVIDGVTMSLTAITTAPVQVSISRDTAAARGAIEDMVNSYRALNNVANQLSEFDPESQVGSILLGDSTLRGVENSIRQVLNTPVDNISSAFSTLSEIGITTDADGNLNIDDAVLDEFLENNLDEVAALFAPFGQIADNEISFVGSTTSTTPGSYDIAVTQLATRGTNAGAAVLPDFAGGGTVTIDATNDTLALTVNGIASSTIVLTQGVYTTGDDLANEIQAAVNGDSVFSEQGVTVAVLYDDVTDTLSIRSEQYGSESNVEITTVDTTTAASLGFDVSSGTVGLDVAGTIAGVAATGTGQVLAGADDSAVEGLTLTVTGGALGPRGSIDFTRGVGDQLDGVLTNLLAEGGLLDARTDGIETRLDGIDDDRADLELRIATIEARLRSQFGALDSLVAQLQSTGAFLQSALASLPAPRSSTSN